MALLNRVELRTPANTERTWARCHVGMESALRKLVKQNGIKGVRFSKDCGELLVNYPRPYSSHDVIVDTIMEMKRVRTRYDSTHTEASYNELQELQKLWDRIVW